MHRRRPGRLATVVVAVGALACGSPDEGAEAEARGAPAAAPPTAGIDFGRVAPGDTVLGLRVDSIDVRADPVDGHGWMGRVRYAGEVALTGEYRPHPDYPELREICFFADDSSGARLPRFPNDVRRPWLCFDDQAAAEEMLGEIGSTGRARIVIDRFDYHYRHTDVYNVARLDSADVSAVTAASDNAFQEPSR